MLGHGFVNVNISCHIVNQTLFTFSYTAPDGTLVRVKFVADENGYQPQSDLLPVAPEFPHKIPKFVLDQIAFAAQVDAARSREERHE